MLKDGWPKGTPASIKVQAFVVLDPRGPEKAAVVEIEQALDNTKTVEYKCHECKKRHLDWKQS